MTDDHILPPREALVALVVAALVNMSPDPDSEPEIVVTADSLPNTGGRGLLLRVEDSLLLARLVRRDGVDSFIARVAVKEGMIDLAVDRLALTPDRSN